MDHNNLLVFGRRMHNGFRRLLITDGDGSNHWVANPQLMEHNLCGVYLVGALAHLEGNFGTYCWNDPGQSHQTLADFVHNHPRQNIHASGIDGATLDALACVRNAFTHNDNDLSLNRDQTSLQQVTNAGFPGLTLNGSSVTLEQPFMDFTRLCFVVTALYKGVTV